MAELKRLLGNAYREGMTTEEIENALARVEVVPKADFDKVMKEAGDSRKKLNARMSEEEKAAQEAANAISEALERAERAEKEAMELRADVMRSNYIAELTAIGFETKDAANIAGSLVTGNMDGVFEIIAKHVKNREASVRADILRTTPLPDGCGGSEDSKKSASDIGARLGKLRASNMKAAEEVMAVYTGGGTR